MSSKKRLHDEGGVNSSVLEDGVVEFTACNGCGYKSASCNDCCMSCGSLNTYKDSIGYQEWIQDY